MPSFHLLATLVYEVQRGGGRAQTEDVARSLRVTPRRAGPLVEAAVNAGLVERREDLIELTDAGLSLAASMVDRISGAETRSVEAFSPYTTYVPERWWP